MQPGLPTFKVMLIGAAGVGKTSLFSKFLNDCFNYDCATTVGIEFKTKEVRVNEKQSVRLQLWDTMGQQVFRSLVRSAYRGVAAVLLVYSIDKGNSIKQLESWATEIKENCHQEVLITVVGTKLDLEDLRAVSKDSAVGLTKNLRAEGPFEISSKTGQNVKELFNKVAKNLHKRYMTSSSFKNLVHNNLEGDQKEGTARSTSFYLKKKSAGTQQGQRKSCCR